MRSSIIFLFVTCSLWLFGQEAQTPEQAAAAKRAERLERNKRLSDAFTAGMNALKSAKGASDFQSAIDNFNKASEIDPRQVAVWAALGEAYTGLGRVSTGQDQTNAYDQAIASYQKSLAIKQEGSVYNQLGLVYGLEQRIPEATEALLKCAELTPAIAPKAYFNLGATLVNSGNPEKSAEYFKKAVDLDPSYAEAWYRYGAILLRDGTVDEDTGQQVFPPDCKTALTRYLDLTPNGINAAKAKMMLEAMDAKVSQDYLPAPSARSKSLSIKKLPNEATLIQKPQPTYPLAAKEARIQGPAKVLLLVSKTGEPRWMRVISSPSSLLSIAALEAVRQWRYEPIVIDGKTTEFATEAVVNFALGQ
jgi:TonB family protein